MLRDVQAIADRVAKILAQGGQPGTLVACQEGLAVFVAWQGDRQHRADAERALCEALGAYDARPIPGLGVLVTERTAARDHEQCVHNQEPRPETVTECEMEAAAAE